MWQTCRPNSPNEVECPIPEFSIPPHLQAALDINQYTASPAYGSHPPAHLPLPSNDTRACRPASATSAPAPGARLNFTFGLTFDGITKYASYGQLTMFAPPRLCFNDTLLTYRFLTNDPIYIRVCTFTNDVRNIVSQ